MFVDFCSIIDPYDKKKKCFLVLVQEGLSLVKNGVSPYTGDVVHEVRLGLKNHCSKQIKYSYMSLCQIKDTSQIEGGIKLALWPNIFKLRSKEITTDTLSLSLCLPLIPWCHCCSSSYLECCMIVLLRGCEILKRCCLLFCWRFAFCWWP